MNDARELHISVVAEVIRWILNRLPDELSRKTALEHMLSIAEYTVDEYVAAEDNRFGNGYNTDRDTARAAAAILAKENEALSKVYALVDAVDDCRQMLHDLAFPAQLECPYCHASEPSVWDAVFEHFAHPAEGAKLKMCHSPWRLRCLRCSTGVTGMKLCAACAATVQQPEAP